ncbi:MAG: Os1348 family NHLP clan protein [Vicinamibacterales bacterium]
MQRSIELLIGRLVTDEDFRIAFHRDPRGTLLEAERWGLVLSAIEESALLSTDQSLWDRVAGELDSRLQKVSLGKQ